MDKHPQEEKLTARIRPASGQAAEAHSKIQKDAQQAG